MGLGLGSGLGLGLGSGLGLGVGVGLGLGLGLGCVRAQVVQKLAHEADVVAAKSARHLRCVTHGLAQASASRLSL